MTNACNVALDIPISAWPTRGGQSYPIEHAVSRFTTQLQQLEIICPTFQDEPEVWSENQAADFTPLSILD